MNIIPFLTSTLIACVIAFSSTSIFAQHGNHAKHNMVMLGEKEIFISHIVYKVPHNFQVILKIKLDPSDLSDYLKAKKNTPKNLMILLLDHMDISKIAEASEISGTIFTEDSLGNRTEIKADVKIIKENFSIIYYDEVPLNLEGVH
ncbi:MAG: hypothetical protein ACOYL6_18300 [Bacteriovoracaceae bacterium]